MYNHDRFFKDSIPTFKCKYCNVYVVDNFYHRWNHLSDAHSDIAVGLRKMLGDVETRLASFQSLADEGMHGHSDSPPAPRKFTGMPEIDDAIDEFAKRD